jgi:hypothetical protein
LVEIEELQAAQKVVNDRLQQQLSATGEKASSSSSEDEVAQSNGKGKREAPEAVHMGRARGKGYQKGGAGLTARISTGSNRYTFDAHLELTERPTELARQAQQNRNEAFRAQVAEHWRAQRDDMAEGAGGSSASPPLSDDDSSTNDNAGGSDKRARTGD